MFSWTTHGSESMHINGFCRNVSQHFLFDCFIKLTANTAIPVFLLTQRTRIGQLLLPILTTFQAVLSVFLKKPNTLGILLQDSFSYLRENSLRKGLIAFRAFFLPLALEQTSCWWLMIIHCPTSTFHLLCQAYTLRKLTS